MSKTLEVVVPFFVLEQGDTLELTEDGKNYVSEYNEEFHKEDEANMSVYSTYNSKFSISTDYAKELIREGFLENKEDEKFVNVFDEINNLITKYSTELSTLDKDCADMPACMKIEKKTVLENMNKVLNHLKSLKK